MGYDHVHEHPRGHVDHGGDGRGSEQGSSCCEVFVVVKFVCLSFAQQRYAGISFWYVARRNNKLKLLSPFHVLRPLTL